MSKKIKTMHHKLEWRFKVSDSFDYSSSSFHTSKWYPNEQQATKAAEKYSSGDFNSISYETRSKS